MALDTTDVISQMENEIERSKQSTGSPTFFVLKDGEKALVRCLLDLNTCSTLARVDLNASATYEFGNVE